MKQTTIARRVETVGIGLHKGEPIRLILEPLDANSGIILHREDLGISFKAEPKKRYKYANGNRRWQRKGLYQHDRAPNGSCKWIRH